jgi:hypothetical protein
LSDRVLAGFETLTTYLGLKVGWRWFQDPMVRLKPPFDESSGRS